MIYLSRRISMPNINVTNFSKEDLISLSQEVVTDLSLAIGCDIDWFNFNSISNFLVAENKINLTNCFVCVQWFKRDEQTKLKVVDILDEALRKRNYEEITIYFEELEKSNYFENKKQFI